MGRQAAYLVSTPTEPTQFPAELRRAAGRLSALGISPALLAALARGASALDEGRVPLIDETPHPNVCRTCGQVAMGEVTERCLVCGAWPQSYQRFLPNYWFDALEPLAALATLRRTPDEVAALLAGLPEAAMVQSPQDGGWAIRNVVTHLCDAQQVFAYRVDLFLAEDHPLLEMKAVWTWAAREEERPPTAAEIFDAYRASRADTLVKLEALPLADWWRTGWHQEFGTVTLRQQVSYFAAHEHTHLPQIAALRRRWTEGE
jgi:uncharacterized damage-inducible protein DinB